MALNSILVNIKKRNGNIVPFNPEKIKTAMEKAFISMRGGVDESLLQQLSEQTIQTLEKIFKNQTPSVEDVQNIVENMLMEAGYFDVAKHYIIYRYEHDKQRQQKKQEVVKKLEEGGIYVTKRNGQKEPFYMDKLKSSLQHLLVGYENIIDIELIAKQIRQEIYEDIPTKDIARAVVMVLRSFIEHDPAYGFAAARGLLIENYKEVIGYDHVDYSELQTQHQQAFKQSIQEGVASGQLDPRMLMFRLDELAEQLDLSRDNLHNYLSTQTLIDRYLRQDPHSKAKLESIQIFWMRIAMGLSLNETTDREAWAVKFYEEMSTLRYIPSTPTLFHAGTSHPQMSSCYITTIQDSLTNIFKCIGDNAQMSKWSGGIGNDWTYLRGTGALIKGTGVSSQGVIPFLKIANDTTGAINRSGRRRGATCAYIETWHWDIEDFLELRKNTGDERRRTHDMNTANWIPDLFMKRVREDGMWSLFSSQEVADLHDTYGLEFERRYEAYEAQGKAGELSQFRQLKARDIWKKMLTMLFETGHPWLTWKDACNLRSPQDHVGVIHSSNLCTEITLNTSEKETAVCNLGSINLDRMITAGKFDTAQIETTVHIAMRMLDNVIDLNFYPTEEGKFSNMKHRPVGLGVRGFQDALYMLGINFDSEEATRVADESMELISYHAILGSSQLAKERGAYQTFSGSKWDRGMLPLDTLDLLEQERGVAIDVKRDVRMNWDVVRESINAHGMRNSNCLAIAPSATTANIAGCVPSIEPIYKNIYVKANQAGDFTIANPYLIAELKKRDLWDTEMLGKLKYHDGSIQAITEIPQDLKDRYKEAFEIEPKWVIQHAAYRGKWIDQSQSINLFYAGRSGKDIANMYMFAWEMGLKTTYYLRTLGVSQVEKSTVQIAQHGETHLRGQKVSSAAASNASNLPAASAPAPANPLPNSDMAPNLSNVPACLITDPDCESCSG